MCLGRKTYGDYYASSSTDRGCGLKVMLAALEAQVKWLILWLEFQKTSISDGVSFIHLLSRHKAYGSCAARSCDNSGGCLWKMC